MKPTASTAPSPSSLRVIVVGRVGHIGCCDVASFDDFSASHQGPKYGGKFMQAGNLADRLGHASLRLPTYDKHRVADNKFAFT